MKLNLSSQNVKILILRNFTVCTRGESKFLIGSGVMSYVVKSIIIKTHIPKKNHAPSADVGYNTRSGDVSGKHIDWHGFHRF